MVFSCHTVLFFRVHIVILLTVHDDFFELIIVLLLQQSTYKVDVSSFAFKFSVHSGLSSLSGPYAQPISRTGGYECEELGHYECLIVSLAQTNNTQ